MSLTDKQSKFVDEYLVDLNATQAAIRAGYSERTAGSQGQRLLKNVEIQNAIAERQKILSEKTSITAQKVLNEYAKIAFSDIKEVLSWDEDGRVSVYQSERIDTSFVQSIQQTTTESDFATIYKLNVKLYDKQKALDALSKHLGLFNVSTTEQLKERLMKAQIDQTEANTANIEARTALIKGAKGDTSILEALIDVVNGGDGSGSAEIQSEATGNDSPAN
ncbi:terminase small subunit [Listeria booriae]|uniref:terminase small subunit n=1 Tax=Listeria booriae TaxID=1552123 RepID=UPI00162429CB|nr:terminase small subunit [Listeria booriae]MBC1231503.1 terminase small subunit [Listeria booriae]MBC1801110.1 terminase small subunit [Listeria booriae]